VTKPLGVGIVGCGGAGRDVAEAIARVPDLALTATHDRLESLAADLALPAGATLHRDLPDLLGDPRVDIVYVGLPHDLLADVAERAIAAGRHVIVEKPLALHLADADRLGHLADASGRTIAPLFELRFAAAVPVARQMIADGAIGPIRVIRITTLIDKPAAYWASGPTGRVDDDWRTRPERAGGGVLLMNTIHLLDLARSVGGVSFVRASGELVQPETTGGIGVEEAAAGVLALSNGGIASVVANSRSSGARDEERIEIDGTEGRVDLPDPYGNGPIRFHLRRPWGGHAARTRTELSLPHVDSHAAFLGAFAAAVRTGGPPPATVTDAREALAAVLAMYESARDGRVIEMGSDVAFGRA
jgi:UDP-N-acetyl-2-amino-2-deoxyglucuronate dehydrogenase